MIFIVAGNLDPEQEVFILRILLGMVIVQIFSELIIAKKRGIILIVDIIGLMIATILIFAIKKMYLEDSLTSRIYKYSYAIGFAIFMKVVVLMILYYSGYMSKDIVKKELIFRLTIELILIFIVLFKVLKS